MATIAQRKANEELHYHNEAAGVAFTAPAGWVVYFRAKNKPSQPNSISLLDPQADAELALLDAFATDSLKEDFRKSSRGWAEADFQENYAKAFKDIKVRPESWKEEPLSGRPAVSFRADYTEGGKPRTAFVCYALGPKVSERFWLASTPEKFDGLKAVFDRIIGSYQHPQ